MFEHWQFTILPVSVIKWLAPGQNGANFADGIFMCIILKQYIYIFIYFWLKFISNGPVDKKISISLGNSWMPERVTSNHYIITS